MAIGDNDDLEKGGSCSSCSTEESLAIGGEICTCTVGVECITLCDCDPTEAVTCGG